MIEVETRGARWCWAAGLFLLIWGAKLVVIDRYASDVPQTDQWFAEGEQLLLPFLQGRLDAAALVQPHNEHRIVCTRALVLGLFVLNGQWDARVEVVVNAALHAALAVIVYFWACAALDPRWRLRWCLIVTGLAALPLAWENLVSGFHSQQYLLLWFSLAALALLLTAQPWTPRWWIGIACAVLALGTMASGLLAAAVVAGFWAVSIRTREEWLRHRPTILICTLIFLAGVLLHFSVPGVENMHARSPTDYLMALSRYLQWQYERLFWFRNQPTVVLAPLQWLPWGWLVWRWWRQGMALAPRERVLLAAGGWTLVQFAASAYARGAGAPWVPSRYVDTLLVGIAVNAIALGIWRSDSAGCSRRQRKLVVAAVIGCACTFVGLGIHVAHFFQHELPRYGNLVACRTAGIQDYLVTGDRSIFAREDLPYQAPISPANLLDRPEIRAILPESLQPFGTPSGPLSVAAEHAADFGPLIAVAGFTLLASVMWQERRREKVSFR